MKTLLTIATCLMTLAGCADDRQPPIGTFFTGRARKSAPARRR